MRHVPPPLTGDDPASPAPDPVPPAAWRSLVMAGTLAAYVILSGVSGGDRPGDGPLLPGSTGELLSAVGLNVVLFLGVAAVAFAFGRPSRAELHAARPVGWLNLVLGFAWSIALRIGIAAGLLGFIAATSLLRGGTSAESLQGMRPKIENLIDPAALADPVYLVLMLTVVSFGLAGLREELWRAGMIAALARLLPGAWTRTTREATAAGAAAVVFGLGHLTQGWGGVALTAVLGIGLGAILVFRRSLAEAVLAHGFFDATTFVFLAVLSNRALLERLGLDPNLLDQALGS